MGKKSNYPVVLLHGMFGFGELEITNKVLPYFGLYKKDIRKMFNKQGIHAVAPSMGPFTSAWNRACEVYAQLVGGTVDYGKAHSEKYGCARYGRTYKKAMLPEWGTVDKKGNVVKINIIGHSFGGVTGRMLTQLLIEGSAEERAVTPPDELSPLFAGGNANLVHSITTLASPHNGMTSVEGSIGKAVNLFCRGICDVMNVLDATPARSIYDLRLDMYGITPTGHFKLFKCFKDKEIVEYLNSEDSIVYDLTLKGAKEVNAKLPIRDNIYYFSFRGCRTRNIFGRQIPKLNMFPLLNVLGFFMGIDKTAPSKKWLANDGVINTYSAMYPDGSPHRNAKPNEKKYKPGIWNVMPCEEKDHMSYCGWTETEKDYAKFYQDIYDRVSKCPTVNK